MSTETSVWAAHHSCLSSRMFLQAVLSRHGEPLRRLDPRLGKNQHSSTTPLLLIDPLPSSLAINIHCFTNQKPGGKGNCLIPLWTLSAAGWWMYISHGYVVELAEWWSKNRIAVITGPIYLCSSHVQREQDRKATEEKPQVGTGSKCPNIRD